MDMCCSPLLFTILVIGSIEFVKPFSDKNASACCHVSSPIPMHVKKTHAPRYQSVFEQYGYSDSGVPKNLDAYKTSIIPQSAITRYVNRDGEWKILSESYYSIIYVGEIKATKKKVIIKEYTKKPDLKDIEEEARIMLYMSDYFPKLYGYVPSGHHLGNLSLVIEFIQNGETLKKALNHGDIELAQVLSIFHQLATAVKTMHERLVLHNDLHLKNVMVQWRGGAPIVRLIDTGLSSFRSGMVGRISTGYSFYPPEYRKNEETTPGSDIFGLGYLMDSVSLENPHLVNLSKLCRSDNATNRPSAYQVVKQIEEIAKLYDINLNQTSFTRSLRPGYRPLYLEDTKFPIISEREITVKCTSSSDYPGAMKACPGVYKNQRVDVRFILKGMENEGIEGNLQFLAAVNGASEHRMIPKIHGVTFLHTKAEFNEIGIVQDHVSVPTTLKAALHVYGQQRWKALYRVEIALKIARIVLYFHYTNHVVNNIDMSNFLHIETSDESASPIIMLSDFSKIGRASTRAADDGGVIRANTYQFDIHKIANLYRELFESTGMPEEFYALLFEEKDVEIFEIEEFLCHILGDC